MLRSSTETSGIRARPQGLWKLPYRDLAESTYWSTCGRFYSEAFTEYTTEDFNTLVSTTLAGFLYVSQLAVKQNAAAEVRQHRQHLNDPG